MFIGLLERQKRGISSRSRTRQRLSSAQRRYFLWSPVAVGVVCADRETGLCSAVPIELFSKPLEPFPGLLRPCTLALILAVGSQLAPCHPYCTAHQFIY